MLFIICNIFLPLLHLSVILPSSKSHSNTSCRRTWPNDLVHVFAKYCMMICRVLRECRCCRSRPMRQILSRLESGQPRRHRCGPVDAQMTVVLSWLAMMWLTAVCLVAVLIMFLIPSVLVTLETPWRWVVHTHQPVLDNLWRLIRGKVIRTVQCCTMYHNCTQS